MPSAIKLTFINGIAHKPCSICKQIKSVDNFGLDASSSNGFASRCRQCDSARATQWCKDNADRFRTSLHSRRKADPERYRQQERDYWAKYPEKKKRNSDAYRARKKNAEGSYAADDLKVIFASQNELCNNPFCAIQLIFKAASPDHIIPLIAGGSNNKENIQLLCLSCNVRKRDTSWDEFLIREQDRADAS